MRQEKPKQPKIVEKYKREMQKLTGLKLSYEDPYKNNENRELYNCFDLVDKSFYIDTARFDDELKYVLCIVYKIPIFEKGCPVMMPKLYCKIDSLKSFFKDYTNDHENSCKDDYYNANMINDILLICNTKVRHGANYSFAAPYEECYGMKHNIIKDNWRLVYEEKVD